MTTMTYHDSYGTISTEQLRLYRKYNVSTSDHDMLVEVYGSGEDGRKGICEAVKRFSDGGIFSEYRMVQAARREGRV